MDLSKALENLKFDVRMKDFGIKHGSVTKEEIQKVMQSLPDDANGAAEVTLEDKPDFGD